MKFYSPETFKIIVDHAWDWHKRYVKANGEMGTFDYPEYGDLPKKISNRLSPEVVDAIQYAEGCNPATKQAFVRLFREQLKTIAPDEYTDFFYIKKKV